MKTILLLVCSFVFAAATRAEPTSHTTPAQRRPFRVLFAAYAGDPKKDRLEAMSFAVYTLDWRQPIGFSKLGEIIPKTKLKLTKFSSKKRKMADGQVKDESELTLTNIETEETAVLVLEIPRDLVAMAGGRKGINKLRD